MYHENGSPGFKWERMPYHPLVLILGQWRPPFALSNAVIDPLNQINLFFLSNRKSCAFGDYSGYNRPSGFQFSENLIFRMENGT